jgi:serine O-acetyltransferase
MNLMNVVSAEVPDWSREHKAIFEWAPSRSLIRSIRCYQRLAKSRRWWAVLPRKLAVLRHRCWSMVTGTDIPLNCRLGCGLLMPRPDGIVIHPDAEICKNYVLFQ